MKYIKVCPQCGKRELVQNHTPNQCSVCGCVMQVRRDERVVDR